MARHSVSIILWVLFIFQSGCAPAELKSWDERLYSYLEEFKNEARLRNVPLIDENYLSVKIVPDSKIPGLLGVCSSEEGISAIGTVITRHRIEIAEKTFAGGDFVVRATIFHELGHCILKKLEHNDILVYVHINSNGVFYYGEMPISLMHKSFFDPDQIPVAKLYWKQYVDELFGTTDNPFTTYPIP